VVPLRVGEIELLGAAVEAVVNHLKGLGAKPPRLAGLRLAAFARDRDAQVPDFAGLLLFGQHRPQVVVQELAVGAGMELVEVYGLQAQRAQGGFKLLAHARGREVFRPGHESLEAVAKLGRHNPARPVVAAEVIADQAFGEVIPVTLGGVEEVDAERARLIEDGVRVGLGESAAPLAAKLPGAQANDRHPQPRAA